VADVRLSPAAEATPGDSSGGGLQALKAVIAAPTMPASLRKAAGSSFALTLM